MAVQQNKKSPSKRGMHRAHDFLTAPAARRRAGHAARCICATTSARAATTAARRSSRPRPTSSRGSASPPACRSDACTAAATRRARSPMRDARHGSRRRDGGRPRPGGHASRRALEFLEAHARRARDRWSASRRRSTRRWRKRARRARDRAHASTPATEVVDMDEPPADALRKKKDSSMRVAINLVKDGDGAGLRVRRQHRRADGDRALRAEDAARHRPARRSRRSCRRRRASRTVLDLGANVNCTPEQLVQFAVMGSALVVGGRRHRAPDGRPAQHRRGGHQGQRRRQAGGRAAARRPASTSTATSRATTSTRARPTSSSATASSATSR